MSGTVIISDHGSYIKIETSCGKSPTETHGALSEVCDEFTVDRIRFLVGLIIFVVVV